MTSKLGRLGRITARAFFLATALSTLAACDLWPGEGIGGAPANEKGWQALPLRSFLTRPSLRARALEFCRANTCGYDAAVVHFSATGDEGDALAASIQDPARLEEAILGEPAPDKVKARVGVQKTSVNAWNGVEIEIEGGKKGRRAYGIALVKRDAADVDALVVVAASPDLARRIATAATE